MKNLCGTAAVREKFGFNPPLWVHTGRRSRMQMPKPEDLPCSAAEKAGTCSGRTKRLQGNTVKVRHFRTVALVFPGLSRFRERPFLTHAKERNDWMSRLEKRILAFSMVAAGVLFVPQNAFAMHIMEGYLPPHYCVAWGVLSLPFLAAGVMHIRTTVQQMRKTLILLAMCGAFVFVVSSLKIPSVFGSCSHMTGTGLAALLFGPTCASVLGLIVLLFQALLLAHGGLTTLGANTFSMAVAGPLLSWGIYQICRKMQVNRKAAVFLAAALGDLFTYCVTSLQLALAYPSEQGGGFASTIRFLGVFAPTQLPLAIIEGILTVLVIMGMESYARPELREIGFLKEAAQ